MMDFVREIVINYSKGVEFVPVGVPNKQTNKNYVELQLLSRT
jgi:hypothetical protein